MPVFCTSQFGQRNIKRAAGRRRQLGECNFEQRPANWKFCAAEMWQKFSPLNEYLQSALTQLMSAGIEASFAQKAKCLQKAQFSSFWQCTRSALPFAGTQFCSNLPRVRKKRSLKRLSSFEPAAAFFCAFLHVNRHRRWPRRAGKTETGNFFQLTQM